MGSHIQVVVRLMLWTILGGPVLAAGEPELGTVQLPRDMTIEVRRSVTGTDQATALPPGRYTVCQWSLRRTDAQGISWSCEGVLPNDKNGLEIVKGQETQLPVGEPLVSTVTAQRRGTLFTFCHKLEGRLGESISIYKDGKAALQPKLRLKNADGSYDQSLAFENT